MSSITAKRIISSLVLGAAVALGIFAGPKFTNGYLVVFGVLIIDEIFCNFFKRRRFSFLYILGQFLFVMPLLYLSYIDTNPDLYQAAVYISLMLNFLLVVYLFYTNLNFNIVEEVGLRLPWITGLILLFPVLSISSFTLLYQWKNLFLIFLLLVIGMDSGAWFFGKHLGRTPLCPQISPNKTVEGLVGGVLTSAMVGILGWNALWGEVNWQLFVLFCLLAALSQVGDLIQSKIKRQVRLKNSSNMLPGHGGIFDRMDSVLFLAPLFLTVLKGHY